MIIINNEEALRIKCEEVLPEEVGALIATLEAELDRANRLGKGGIGLAAPQIGIPKKISIIRLDKSLHLDLVNCQIKAGYDSSIFRQEGCLSFPGRVEDTLRYQEIHVINNLVYPHDFVATGLLSVVCQHEIDHLNGQLFMDHMIKPITPILSQNLIIKTRPNDLCACGSLKKYKRCCGVKK